MAQQRAKDNAKQAKSKVMSGKATEKTAPCPLDEHGKIDDQKLFEEKYASQLRLWSRDFFPSWWITMLLIGEPCVKEDYRCPLLVSGKISKLTDNPFSTIEELGGKYT